jgi:hypothetical protein
MTIRLQRTAISGDTRVLNRMLFGAVAATILASAPVVAQDGPAEFSSAPCSTVMLGLGDEVSHLQRIYLFQGTTQTTQYKYFADPGCTKPLYSFVFQGTVELGQPVPGLPDTVEAKVTFTRTLFTLDSPRGADAAKDCADGDFAVGVQRDVSEASCFFMRPISSCGIDYDIVQIKDGVAIPGFRTENMCTPEGRPTRLQTVGARFLEQF